MFVLQFCLFSDSVQIVLVHGYVKGISVSAVTVGAKAVRQVQNAPFTLSVNTPRRKMVMSGHCTIRSYHSIFCITPIMNTENV